MKINKNTPQEMMIDYWYSEKQQPHKPKQYYADASFYPSGSFGYSYRGNIYNSERKMIGDYGTNDSAVIENNFIISFD